MDRSFSTTLSFAALLWCATFVCAQQAPPRIYVEPGLVTPQQWQPAPRPQTAPIRYWKSVRPRTTQPVSATTAQQNTPQQNTAQQNTLPQTTVQQTPQSLPGLITPNLQQPPVPPPAVPKGLSVPGTPIPQSSLTPSHHSLQELLSNDDESETQHHAVRAIDSGWWTPMVQSSLRRDANPVTLSLDETLVRTLRNSKQIQVFSELPLIRETSITEANAAFDWSAFMDTRWDDVSDPVGNSLTAGAGINRFKDHNLSSTAGLRKRTASGGKLELSQRFGIQENNSTFFTPNNQATSRLVLSYTQPLMRGKGRVYNESLICLAHLDKKIADEEFVRQLQSHLLEVTRSYWALYLERGTFLQKLNSYARAKDIVGRLEQRRNIDATESQITSAQAALKSRRAELARAKTAIRNAEARLRSMVNDPGLGNFEDSELVPLDHPSFQALNVDLHGSLEEAVRNRPEINQSIKQIKAASIRCNMSKHELLPALNLVTETYVSGLEDERDAGAAWGNQFDQGEPSYSIGLQFEVPIHNRAAKARYLRRRHEVRQMQNQYSTALETIHLEVEVAVREVGTSQRELYSKEDAMHARLEQLDYISERWRLLPGEDSSASLTLENLLTGQERLAATEYEFLQSQMTYNLSLTNLKRAMGTLLQHEGIHRSRSCVNGLPTNHLSRQKLTVSDGDLRTATAQ